MAKIVEETLLVKFSTLVRSDDDGDSNSLIGDKTIATVEAAIQEVLDLPDGVVIEVESSAG